MKQLMVFSAAMAVLVLATPTGGLALDGMSADETGISIDVSSETAPISPYIYGQFIEHLGRCIYGGIWAEMLEDRKFYYPVDGTEPAWRPAEGNPPTEENGELPFKILVASPWKIVGDRQAVSMTRENVWTGEHDVLLSGGSAEAPNGICQEGLALVAGKSYLGRVVIKKLEGNPVLRISLRDSVQGSIIQQSVFEKLTPDFSSYEFEFNADGDNSNAALALEIIAPGKVQIGAVSLMPSDNVEGFRADTLALLRELNAPVYRWPGGNFVSGYDWRDGIGERDKRPPRKNPAWTGVEPNDVGIHEFLRFCELVNAEPYVAINTGLGSVESGASLVRYVTSPPDTPEGAERARNGRKEPWPVKWWCVGNEMYGDWQLGHVPLEEYQKRHNAFAEAIRAAQPDAILVGVGAVGNWSEGMLKHCGNHMDHISEHTYWGDKKDVWEYTQQAVEAIDNIANAHRKYRMDLPELAGKDIRIVLDEWNYWHGPHYYGELGVRYFHKDALGAARALHALHRNSDMYVMANYAQTVNVIGAIKTTRTKAIFDATALPLKLYREHFGNRPVLVSCGIPKVDASAALTEDGKTLTLGIVNCNAESITVPINIRNGKASLAEPLKGWLIQQDDPMAANVPSKPDNITIREQAFTVESGNLALPALSISLIHIPVTR